METFSALLAICAGNSPVPGEFPTQRPATRSCDVFFDLRLNKQLCKQSWGWLFETLSRPLWRQCNDYCSCRSGKMHRLQVPLPGFPSVYWSVLGSRRMGWWRYKHMLARIQAHIRNTWRCILYLNTSHIITQRMQNNLKIKKMIISDNLNMKKWWWWWWWWWWW